MDPPLDNPEAGKLANQYLPWRLVIDVLLGGLFLLVGMNFRAFMHLHNYTWMYLKPHTVQLDKETYAVITPNWTGIFESDDEIYASGGTGSYMGVTIQGMAENLKVLAWDPQSAHADPNSPNGFVRNSKFKGGKVYREWIEFRTPRSTVRISDPANAEKVIREFAAN